MNICIWCNGTFDVRQMDGGDLCSHCRDEINRRRDCPWCRDLPCYDASTLCKEHWILLMDHQAGVEEVHGRHSA